MADERLNDLQNTQTMNNGGVVDTADSERVQQEYLVTQTAQAKYEKTRAQRIAKQDAYTTLYGQYKVLEGRYTTNREGKKLSMSFQFPNNPAGLEAALDNDAELVQLKADLDVEKAKLDAAEAEYKAEKAVEEAYKNEWDALKEGFKAGKPIETVLNEVPPTNEAQVREQTLNPDAANEQPVPEQAPAEQASVEQPVVMETVQTGNKKMDGPIPESALPKAEKQEKHDFAKNYQSTVDKEKIKDDSPEARWSKIMERVLSEDTPEAAMDALFLSVLAYPMAFAAYQAELYAAEKKDKIKYVDDQAASWNKTMRKLKGLSEADVLQAVQGDFLHNPEGLIARYNKDVYDGLTTDENGRYSGEQAALLRERIAQKEAALHQTNPELFVGLQRGEDGSYSKADAEIFRTRYLIHQHPDLLSGIQKDENGAYSEKDIALFKERLLTKNFMTVYEREPTVREQRGLMGGFKNREQTNQHIKALEGIYGLALGMNELALKESQIPGRITHDMQQGWANLRDEKIPFDQLTPGLEKAYVDVPSAKDKYQEWHAAIQARQTEKPEPAREPEYKMATPPAPEFHIDPQMQTESPYVTSTPKAPDIFMAPQPVRDDVHVSQTADVKQEAVVPEKRAESYKVVPPTLTVSQPEKMPDQMPQPAPTVVEPVVHGEILPDHFKVPENAQKVEPVQPTAQPVSTGPSIQATPTVQADRPVHPTKDMNMPSFGVTPPAPMAAPASMEMPQNTVQMSDVTVDPVKRPETTVNRPATTLNQAHENLNAAGTIDAMKTEKNGLDKAVTGIRSKEQQLTVDGQALARLTQNVTIRAPENGLGRTNDQHSL